MSVSAPSWFLSMLTLAVAESNRVDLTGPEVTEEEVLDNKYQNTILMISNKKIRSNKKLEEFVNGKEHYVIGRFSVMVL